MCKEERGSRLLAGKRRAADKARGTLLYISFNTIYTYALKLTIHPNKLVHVEVYRCLIVVNI